MNLVVSGENETIGTRACDWKIYKTEDGKEYYFNVITRKTQWNKPQELIEDQRKLVRDECDWREYESNGKKYYYNVTTKESVWEKPEEFVEYEKEQERVKSMKLNQKINYDQFYHLLEEIVPSSDWEWNYTVKKIVYDPRYKLIGSMEEKKKIFNKFIQDKKKREDRSKKKQEEKKKSDFFSLLGEKKIEYSRTRFSDLITSIEDDEKYQNVDNEDERLKYFDEYVQNLEIKEKKEKEKTKEQKQDKFYGLLLIKYQQGFININNTWREVRKLVEKEKEYRNIDHEYELLRVWSKFIRKLEREEELKNIKKNENKKDEERNNRVKYWKVLLELEKQNKINVNSEWKNDIREKIKQTNEYIKVRNQSMEGKEISPSPRDLFYEFIDDLEIKYQKEKKILKEIMKKKNLTIDLDLSYKDFVNSLQDNESFVENFSKKNNLANVEIYYEHTIKRRKKKHFGIMKKILKNSKMKIEEDFKYENFLENLNKQKRNEKEKEDFKKVKLGDEEKKKYFERFKKRRLKKRERARKRKRDDYERDDYDRDRHYRGRDRKRQKTSHKK